MKGTKITVHLGLNACVADDSWLSCKVFSCIIKVERCVETVSILATKSYFANIC